MGSLGKPLWSETELGSSDPGGEPGNDGATFASRALLDTDIVVDHDHGSTRNVRDSDLLFAAGSTLNLARIAQRGQGPTAGPLAFEPASFEVQTLLGAGDNYQNDTTAHWNCPIGYGNPQVVTYSFLPTVAFYDNPAERPDFTPLNADEMEQCRAALQKWAAVSGLVFVEVPDAVGGDIRFGLHEFDGTDVEDAIAYAYLPYFFEDGSANYFIGGDIWFDLSFTRVDEAGDLEPGSLWFETAMHEIGHALGFKHPFDDSPTLPFAQDNTSNTVMSYRDIVRYPDDIGPYDVEAIQYVYGDENAWADAGLSLSWDDVNYIATITGDGTANSAVGTNIADMLIGNGGGDELYGAEGDDTIDGGGDGFLSGGDQNDTYLLYGDNDVVEEFNYGTSGKGDTVDYSLAAWRSTIDLIQGLGYIFAAIGNADTFSRIENATGSAFADTIIGSNIINLQNILRGGDGRDTVEGRGGIDKIFGNADSDTLDGGAQDDALNGGAGNDTLTGGSHDDSLIGGKGNDLLDGGGGTDTMQGDDGNDTYVVSSTADVATEGAAGGTDTVQSAVTLTLGANLENLVLIGNAANGYGNALANEILGNSRANILKGYDDDDAISGGAGNDTLYGQNGNDTLDGGAGVNTLTGAQGNDAFVFAAAVNGSNLQNITDFKTASDTMHLDNAVMSALGAEGAFAASAFAVASAAADADDRIVYDGATGDLFYDADGDGAGAQVRIGSLDAGLALTSAQFLVV